ncbi:preprotein translocase subunit SecY [Candidatus Saccharibacteria bacterium CPR2]|nr:preprotein translocase subunit SecY [Candidatus Saccharibacteria bacterium CPR2]
MNWKTIGKSFKNKDMLKRIFFVLLAMVIYRALSHLPIPLGGTTELKQVLESIFNQQQLLGFINLLSGGALANFSIVLMGLGPYINASIIMQLLTKAIPKLEEMSEEGEHGRQKINQYTRYLTLPLAILQSVGFILLIRQTAQSATGLEDFLAHPSIFQWVLMGSALTGGSMLLMWIGELMTEQGVGNGISLLIFAGIASQLFSTGAGLVQSVVSSEKGFEVFGWFALPFDPRTVAIALAFILGGIGLTYFVVKINEAQRVITVSYAKRVRGNRAYGGVETILPIKLIAAGVIPIIFAVAFLAVPSFVGQLMISSGKEWMVDIGNKLVTWFQTNRSAGLPSNNFNTYGYPAIYFLLVVMFTYFYTGIVFNAKQIAENLQKQGGFIAGIRPGPQTESYLKKVVIRLTLFGSISLGILAILPLIVERVLGTQQLTIGGTGVLIVVSVALETLRQLESRALMITYDYDND